MMFNGDENKPISIIITTLAARAYNKETDVLDALVNVVNSMEKYIERDSRTGQYIVQNPVNSEENFADKWIETPQKQQNFFAWLNQVKQDVEQITEKKGGLQLIAESMNKPFGKDLVKRTYMEIAYNQHHLCIYHRPSEEWNASHKISEIVPWISEWFYYYENWLVTAKWLGGGIHGGKKE